MRVNENMELVPYFCFIHKSKFKNLQETQRFHLGYFFLVALLKQGVARQLSSDGRATLLKQGWSWVRVIKLVKVTNIYNHLVWGSSSGGRAIAF